MACAVASVVAMAGSAGAATMTFDNLTYPDYSEPGDGQTFVEGGITATSLDPYSIIANYFTPSSAAITDSGTEYTSGIGFTAGRLISSAVFRTVSLGYDSFIGRKLPFNVVIGGYFMGRQVASSAFRLSDDIGKVQTFTLTAQAGRFDRVTIQLLYPDDCYSAPCAAFDLDQVDLALVPLPAAGLGLAGALTAMAGIARRRRVSRAA